MKSLKLIVFTVAVFAAAIFFGNVGTVRAQSGSMQWSGMVDDVLEISIRNRNAQSRTISGRDYDDDDFRFRGRAPRRNADVSVNKTDGRGKVSIVQRPNRRNNFTTIVQIVDKKGGADRYRFTLDWNGDDRSGDDRIQIRID
jgi:hypothetical protein